MSPLTPPPKKVYSHSSYSKRHSIQDVYIEKYSREHSERLYDCSIALPIVVGAWPMAILLWQRINFFKCCVHLALVVIVHLYRVSVMGKTVTQIDSEFWGHCILYTIWLNIGSMYHYSSWTSHKGITWLPCENHIHVFWLDCFKLNLVVKVSHSIMWHVPMG